MQVHFTRHPWLQIFRMVSISDYLDDIVPFFFLISVLFFITVITVVKVLILYLKMVKRLDIVCTHPLLSCISTVQSLTCSHDFRKYTALR